DRHLVAYVVPQALRTVSVPELRQFLGSRLPAYMVPSAFVTLDRLPLNPTGKLDRPKLPAPDGDARRSGVRVAPRDPIEQQLLQIWEKVLGIRTLGIHDNFFEVGGHSLLGVRLLAQIEKGFGRRLFVATLFRAPTIERMAEVLRQDGWTPTWPSLVPIRPGG